MLQILWQEKAGSFQKTIQDEKYLIHFFKKNYVPWKAILYHHLTKFLTLTLLDTEMVFQNIGVFVSIKFDDLVSYEILPQQQKEHNILVT